MYVITRLQFLWVSGIGQPSVWYKPKNLNEKAGFVQMNLRMLQTMGTDVAIRKANPDEIDITKVLSFPSRLEIEEHSYFVYE